MAAEGRRIRIRLIALALAALGLAAACAQPSSQPPPVRAERTPVPTPDPGQFDVLRAMDHVHTLAVEIGPRDAGSDGDRRAREYVASQLAELGWEVIVQPFQLPQGGETANVIAFHPSSRRGEPWLLFGGHLDSIGGPGANDNASGVAVALEMARALTERRSQVTAGFVAFAAEERQPAPGNPNHLGSNFYVRALGSGLWSTFRAFVNLDMVGNGEVIYCARLSMGPTEATERCLRTAEELDIHAEERITPDWSDNGPFLRDGRNAAWLWTGEVPCCFHNELDNFDNVNSEDVDRVGRLALAIVRSYMRHE